MAGATTGAGQPGLGAAARFELASFEVRGEQLVVTGAWSSVRGLRFVRPTLLVDGRKLLAALEHKPWDPGARPWVAAFAWHGEAPDAGDVRLSVAPSITVELATGEPVAPRFAREQGAPAPAPERDELVRVIAERDQAIAERDAATAWRDEAIAERDRAHAERDKAVAELEDTRRRETALQGQVDVLHIDITEARQSAERAVRSAEEAQARADHAQREAIAARQDRDEARAALARPVAPEEVPSLGPFTSMSSPPPPSGRELWGARAVIILATIIAIVILARVLT